MSKQMILSVEEAGAGFAGSIALAERYRGLEIGSIQVLKDIGLIDYINKSTNLKLSDDERNELVVLLKKINITFIQQSEGWLNRPIFERQWIIRDFKKYTGSNVEIFKNTFSRYINMIDSNEISLDDTIYDALKKLSIYYRHQIDLLKGYETDHSKVVEQTNIIMEWINNIENLTGQLNNIKYN